jgi:hypothetical protein
MTNRPFCTAAIFALGALCLSASAQAQSPDTAADTVRTFMTAFNAKDGEGMSAVVMEGAMLAMISKRGESESAAILPLSGLIAATVSAPFDLKEPTWNLRVLEDGPVASIFADYEFLIDGKRSHCGTNVFQLIRAKDSWKIAGLTYSDFAEGCETRSGQ